MHRITKRLLVVLLSIMAYLPMTVVNAMPNVSIPIPSQSVMGMDAMAMMDMAAAECHQTDKSCDHCSSQYTAHCAHSAYSASLAITTQYSLLSINRNLQNSDKTLRSNMQFQQTTPLFRPPISS